MLGNNTWALCFGSAGTASQKRKRQRLSSNDSPAQASPPSPLKALGVPYMASPTDAAGKAVATKPSTKSAAADKPGKDQGKVESHNQIANDLPRPVTNSPMAESQETAGSEVPVRREKKRKKRDSMPSLESPPKPAVQDQAGQHELKGSRKKQQASIPPAVGSNSRAATAEQTEQKLAQRAGMNNKQKARARPSTGLPPMPPAGHAPDKTAAQGDIEQQRVDALPSLEGPSAPASPANVVGKSTAQSTGKKRKASAPRALEASQGEAAPPTDAAHKDISQQDSRKQKSSARPASEAPPLVAPSFAASDKPEAQRQRKKQKASMMPPLADSATVSPAAAADRPKAQRKSKKQKASTMPPLGDFPAGSPPNAGAGVDEVERDWRTDRLRKDVKTGR